ncbi:MAG: hypothetical protein ACK55I_38650, partial [bacterium]
SSRAQGQTGRLPRAAREHHGELPRQPCRAGRRPRPHRQRAAHVAVAQAPEAGDPSRHGHHRRQPRPLVIAGAARDGLARGPRALVALRPHQRHGGDQRQARRPLRAVGGGQAEHRG